MAIPKSVTRITTKGGVKVEFRNNLDKTEYYIYELCRAALRDVMRFVQKTFKYDFYQHFGKRTGAANYSTTIEVLSNRKTKFPRANIGLSSRKMKGFYAYYQEVGTEEQPRLGLLQHAVEDNVDTIIEIESQYLSALSSDENSIEGMIDENEYGDNE